MTTAIKAGDVFPEAQSPCAQIVPQTNFKKEVPFTDCMQREQCHLSLIQSDKESAAS